MRLNFSAKLLNIKCHEYFTVHVTIFTCFVGHSCLVVELFVIHVNNKCINFATYVCTRGHAVAQLVEALRYKSEGRGFDWNFH